MEIEQLLKEKREEILQIALRHGAKNIRLFGSVARGEAGESSDVDILVEVVRILRLVSWRLIADLEELLGRRSTLSRSEHCIHTSGTEYCKRQFPYER